MAEMALVATVAGSALSGYSQIMQGREQSRAAQYEQQQLNIDKQTTQIKAAQQESQRREELTNALESVQAFRSGRGLGSFSPGGLALFDKMTTDQEFNIRNENLSAKTKEGQDTLAANLAASKGRTSLLAGYLGAGATAFNAISSYNRYSNYPVSMR